MINEAKKVMDESGLGVFMLHYYEKYLQNLIVIDSTVGK